jgi:hypothetical protein
MWETGVDGMVIQRVGYIKETGREDMERTFQGKDRVQ